MALTDMLDDLISERRIEPQLAMKILANFDRSITEVLADKVKARLTFKVHFTLRSPRVILWEWDNGLM
jgi:transcription initiation factor TFIIA small subunit